MQVIKILNLIPSFQGGGAERQLALISACLSQSDLEVHIAYLHDGINLEHLKMTKVNLHRIHFKSNYDPRILFQLIKIIRKIKPNIINTWLPQMDILGGICGLIMGIPTVLSERSSSLAYKPGIRSHIRLFFGRRAKAVIANSLSGLAYWSNGPALKFIVNNGISNDLDLVKHDDFIDVPNIANKKLILFAGRLSYEKNIFLLISALNKVMLRRDDCYAVFCGDGPLGSQITAEIKKRDLLSRVFLVGYTKNLLQVMKRASVIVSPSIFEGSPNVVMEAMNVGCPIILSDIPQHRDIVPIDGAIFCTIEDDNELFQAINFVLDHPRNCDSMIKIAKQSVAMHTIEKAAAKYYEIYSKLI